VTALQVAGGLVALALFLVGVAGWIAPRRAAAWYGVSAGDEPAPHALARAAALRDVVMGVVLAAAVYFRDVPLTIVIAIAGIVLAIGDAAIVYHASGRRWHRAHGSHLVGIVAFVLVLAMALLAVGI
jgi:hypothetical protein